MWPLLERDSQLVPVRPEEESFLKGICGTGHHFGMSRGYIREGQTFVTEGPLQGKEHLIRRIDRHKRIARVGTPGEDRAREVQVGLEIVTKS